MYIGQTRCSLQKRKREHFCSLRNNKHNNQYLQRAWNKYGESNFVFEQIDDARTIDELNQKEIYWIAKLNTMISGYNLTGGGNVTNIIHEDTRKKLRQSKLGKKNPMFGKKVSIHTKQLMSLAKKGNFVPWHAGASGVVHRTSATKQKLRVSKLGKKNPMFGKPAHNRGKKLSKEAIDKFSKSWKFTNPVGQSIEFINLTDFCRNNNLVGSCMHAVFYGNRKSHKGWRQ